MKVKKNNMTEKSIINWDNVFSQSSTFKKNTPCKFAFVENFIEKNFYEKLYNTYPKIDETWFDGSNMTKSQFSRAWGGGKPKDVGIIPEIDSNLSKEWNEFKCYIESPEFIENIRNFSGVPVNKLKGFSFTAYGKGGFQLPHIHNAGTSTLIMMIYFSKNWNHGDPGGTYILTDVDDESSIIFEPYNLDNSFVIFHDGPSAAHGVRQITKDVKRNAIQLYLEEKTNSGWTGYSESSKEAKRELKDI